MIEVPRSNFLPNRFQYDEIDKEIITDKQLFGGAKLKRSYFKPREDIVLLHVKVASTVLMEGLILKILKFFLKIPCAKGFWALSFRFATSSCRARPGET